MKKNFGSVRISRNRGWLEKQFYTVESRAVDGLILGEVQKRWSWVFVPFTDDDDEYILLPGELAGILEFIDMKEGADED